ncbi:methyl-accepting chemotaxis protein [Candidatus Magnetomorum sp. HK-1]|nr:methyl-accepting chemotaxis protein [Candidatus Magnetomorum sp. HK-1]
MLVKKFQTKITFWAGVCLIISATFIVTSFAISMNRWAKEHKTETIQDAKRYAVSIAEKHASAITATLEVPLDSARTLAQAFSGIRNPATQIEIDREETNGILKILLSKNQNFHAVYTAWESNAFDDMDRGYINDTGHDHTGRFIPYWYRNEKKQLSVRPLIGYEKPETGEYYHIPKSTHQESLFNPFFITQNDIKIYMTSLVAPIMVDKTFYGIVGVDLKLDDLQAQVDKVDDIYEGTGRILVLSNNKIIAAATSRPDLIGTNILDITYDMLFQNTPILQSNEISSLQNDFLEVDTTISPGRTSNPWSVKVIIPTYQILKQGHQEMDEAKKDLLQMILINILGVLMFMIVIWFSAGKLAKPIRLGAEALQAIAEGKGDLTQRLPVHSSDEAGMMSLWFNRFMDNLQDLIINIANGLNTLLTSVNNISSSIERQVTILSQQSASVTEITGTMSELTTSSTQIADHASKVAELSETTLKNTKQGVDIVNELQGAMENINVENKRNVQEILALGKKSKEVNKVIEIINNITDQTKLIAFNAALEASSAGDSGKRFSVVAVEIRRLADSVIDSTRETESIINEIDESVNRMIIDSEKRAKNINKGMESASNTSDTFMEIVSSAQTTTNASHQISLSTQQQKSASEQVISALREIDEGVKQSTNSMKDIRSICSELQDLSNLLRNIVDQFNVFENQKNDSSSEMKLKIDE